MSENRFLEVDEEIHRLRWQLHPHNRDGRHHHRHHYDTGVAAPWFSGEQSLAFPMSATDRALVVLINNGGVDLGIPELVEKVLAAVPGGRSLPVTAKTEIVEAIRRKLREVTNNLLETAELTLNRYTAAKPDPYGSVIVLRDSHTVYAELKRTLIDQTNGGKLIDLIVLTHGGNDVICLEGDVNGAQIRAIRTEAGKPIRLRAVYMMNCVGSSMNQAWLDAGAKASAGTLHNNYLPEPTTHFFWKNWRAGQNFEQAVTSAYRQTVALMNDVVRGWLIASPIPNTTALAALVDFANFDFVRDSAPVVQGQRTLTISTDDLDFSQNKARASSLATVVLPVHVAAALSAAAASGQALSGAPERKLSDTGLTFLRSFQSIDPSDKRIADAQQTLAETVSTPLNQNQIDALISFIIGVGDEPFRSSTLLRQLNGSHFVEAAEEIKKWTKSRQNGQVVDVPELTRRRAAEADLLLRPLGAGPTVSQAMDDSSADAGQSADDLIGGTFAHATCLPTSMALLAASHAPVSEAMYDTGEHAWSADGLYTTPLFVGLAPGVAFSYAQLVTMADLYAGVEQLMMTPASELTTIKGLIDRDTVFYRDHRGTSVRDEEWNKATNGRFLHLAEGNSSHFAPDTLFTGDPIAHSRPTIDNHKEYWQANHLRALTEARSGSGTPTPHAFIVNAFGDHFLTDAFAAGHLVNKDVVVNFFVHNFMNGRDLTPAANSFFARVALAAWANPGVRQNFSDLREPGPGHWIAQHLTPVDTLIDTVDHFALLLKAICKEKPELVANLAVKALHDDLNRNGVRVSNDAGDPEWLLKGDGHLGDTDTAATRPIMQKAVRASLDNIQDPQLRATPDAACFARVWRFAPKLVPSEVSRVIGLVREYTNPNSTIASAAAAQLVIGKAGTMRTRLLDEHRLTVN